MSHNWWKEPDDGAPPGERLYRAACTALDADDAECTEDAWKKIKETSPSDDLWHSLSNCVGYQARVWESMVSKGEVGDVRHPAAFLLAIVLRHTPIDVATKLVADLLHTHSQCEPLTKYILALLTDEDPQPSELDDNVAPLRDLQLFGDCELSILAAPSKEYDTHSKLVRAEYCKMTYRSYIELRIKVLNQLLSIPQLFHTAEFSCLEQAARANIAREIASLKEHLTSNHEESS